MEYYLNFVVLICIAVLLSVCIAMIANEIKKIRESHKKEDQGRADLIQTIREMRAK